MKQLIKILFTDDDQPTGRRDTSTAMQILATAIFLLLFILVCGFAGWLDSRW